MAGRLGQSWCIGQTNFNDKTKSGEALALEAIEPRRLYRQVADQIRTYLDSGALPVGARLPTERELAEKLNVSRPTIREALIALEVEGRIRIRVGSGIYVSEPFALGDRRRVAVKVIDERGNELMRVLEVSE